MDRADTFRTRCVNPSSRAGDHHDVGFFHQIVQAAAIHSRVSSDGNTVNGRKVLGLDPYDAETDPVTDAKKE